MVSSISQIPTWIYAVLVVLGWNEFVAVLRNPIYFTFLVLAAAGAAVTVQLGMTGPVTAVIRGVFNEVVKTVNDQLRVYFQDQSADAHVRRQGPVPVAAAGKRAEPETIELKEKVKEKVE